MRDQVLRIIGALKRDQPDDVPDPDDRTLMAHRLERVLDQLEAGNWASAEACLDQCDKPVPDSWPQQSRACVSVTLADAPWSSSIASTGGALVAGAGHRAGALVSQEVGSWT